MSIPAENHDHLADKFEQTAAPAEAGKSIFPPEGHIRIVVIAGEDSSEIDKIMNDKAVFALTDGMTPSGLSLIYEECPFFEDIPVSSDMKASASASDEEAFLNSSVGNNLRDGRWQAYREQEIDIALTSGEFTGVCALSLSELQANEKFFSYAIDVPAELIVNKKCQSAINVITNDVENYIGQFKGDDFPPDLYIAFIPSEDIIKTYAAEGLWLPVCADMIDDEDVSFSLETAIHESMHEVLVDLDKGLKWMLAANDLIVGQEISPISLESHGQMALDI